MSDRTRVYAAARDNPTIWAYVKLCESGEVTWAQAMEGAALDLHAENTVLARRAVDAELRAMPEEGT